MWGGGGGVHLKIDEMIFMQIFSKQYLAHIQR